jgi:hypothetical protein
MALATKTRFSDFTPAPALSEGMEAVGLNPSAPNAAERNTRFTLAALKAFILGGHTHPESEPVITKNTAFNKDFGTGAGEVSEGNHTHSELHTHPNQTALSNITDTGDGTRFLADDGTYKLTTEPGYEITI